MIGRLVHKVDIERVLAVPYRLRSAHFAVHHLAQSPLPATKPIAKVFAMKLSTSDEGASSQPVDNLPHGHWMCGVVPKRHARRAVTRSLLKRQIRCALQRHAAVLPAGLWLVRLRAPFSVTTFVSARSQALRQTARAELDGLLGRVAA
jgi:ribonuclease P protein component